MATQLPAYVINRAHEDQKLDATSIVPVRTLANKPTGGISGQ